MKVPFNKEYYTGKEKEYINDVLDNRAYIRGDGYYTKIVTDLLERKFSVYKIFMTTSGTHALEMSTSLLGIKKGDEVIMPSYTFPSTANAVLKNNGRPVFAEIKPDTLNIDPDDIIKNISKKTKAIMPIHYAGISADMDKIKGIAKKYDLYIIEDAAQAVNAKYKGNYLGTLGDLGCFSFHSTKNYISGEGGALLINLKDENLVKKAAVLREKGTNRFSFLKGEVDKYTWVEQGSSYLPSDLLMAFLYAQLEKMDEIKYMRKKSFEIYQNKLSEINKYAFINSIIKIPKNRESNYNSFYIIFNNNKIRDKVIELLKEKGIEATFHYIPLHISEMGKKLGYQKGDFPITEKLANNILRLPLYTHMTEKEVNYVIKNIKEIFEEIK
ncbi:MAG TPA: dTDP-4-amino-4,6-dideoxygalactose transaminase [Halanaerobiales bacterium]|nr:dTDP-4-amino-4,6-dideoxygalactose transaminase [Halanaerobiales bacterium]